MERRLKITELRALIESLIVTLVRPETVASVAQLADIDPVLVPAPERLDFITGPLAPDLLDLEEPHVLEDAGPSHGANLFTDPALDLRLADERDEQVRLWLRQIGQDAGLRGMERLLESQAFRPGC